MELLQRAAVGRFISAINFDRPYSNSVMLPSSVDDVEIVVGQRLRLGAQTAAPASSTTRRRDYRASRRAGAPSLI
jgi:hypothetical protein